MVIALRRESDVDGGGELLSGQKSASFDSVNAVGGKIVTNQASQMSSGRNFRYQLPDTTVGEGLSRHGNGGAPIITVRDEKKTVNRIESRNANYRISLSALERSKQWRLDRKSRAQEAAGRRLEMDVGDEHNELYVCRFTALKLALQLAQVE